MDYFKIIKGLLSKANNLDDGKIAELFKEGEDVTEETVLAKLLELDASRVANIKKQSDTTGKFQEGYAKAKKEERVLFENEIKEQFKIESNTTGLDLINEIVSTKAEEAGKGKKGEVTEDDVRRHSVYQGLETRYKTDLKAKDEEWQAKLTNIETEHNKAKTFSQIEGKALAILEGLKPILPSDTNVAGNQKRWFVSALKDYGFEIQNDQVVVFKDGVVHKDSHENNVRFEDLVKNKASEFFEFQKNNGGGNAGNSNEGGEAGGGAYPAGIARPKNIDELSKVINDENIKPEDRQRVMEEYEKEFG